MACPYSARVLTYNPSGHTKILQSFKTYNTTCADYYVHVPPPSNDKLSVAPQSSYDAVRDPAYPNIHPVAEFDYQAWKSYNNDGSAPTWEESGIQFRMQMASVGMGLNADDMWVVNEASHEVRDQSSTVRNHIRSLCKGLYNGDGTVPQLPGILFQEAVGSGLTDYSVYKPGLKYWLGDTNFWNDLYTYVRWYYYEVYGSPTNFLVSGADVANRSAQLQDYSFHPYNLAHACQSNYPTAWQYLSNRLYAPFGTAYWQSDAYGGTQIALSSMEAFVCLQIYSYRLYAQNASWHYAPAGRLGFAWHDGPSGDANYQTLADRLANSILLGYGDGGTPRYCCDPSGSYGWCNGNLYDLNGNPLSASFNTGWSSFNTC